MKKYDLKEEISEMKNISDKQIEKIKEAYIIIDSISKKINYSYLEDSALNTSLELLKKVIKKEC